jgi:hypothetical protein
LHSETANVPALWREVHTFHGSISVSYRQQDAEQVINKSLLTSFSKIFEKLIFTRLYNHLCTNGILVKEQYGFKSNSSAENAAYNVINEITKVMNGRRSLGGLFCDLEKAFDCVYHKILLGKLEFYGVKGKFLDLIQSFLQQRCQKVFINKNAAHDGTSSEWMAVTHGVPQGPIPILICINDLPLIAGINSKIVPFADDTSTIMTSSNQVELKAVLHKTLSDINSWFKANLLSLNINKTYFLHF